MSLNKINESVYILEGAVNISVILGDEGALVIDTGLGDSGARKVRRWLDENSIRPCAIINTHSHADHFGGNEFLLKKYPELMVYAPAIEDAFIKYPVLELAFLFGAEPREALKTGFLMSPPSKVDEIIEPGNSEICGLKLKCVPLPGHSFNQIGVIFEDVFFSADALFVEDLIKKYGILYFVDFEKSIETLEKLKEYRGLKFIPGHRRIEGDVVDVINKNLKHFESVQATVQKCLTHAKPIRCAFEKFGIPNNPVNRALSLVPIKATLLALDIDFFELI